MSKLKSIRDTARSWDLTYPGRNLHAYLPHARSDVAPE